MGDEVKGRHAPLGPSGPWDGTPAWAYDEDGYCVCCGNGHWKFHMPECDLRDALDIVDRVAKMEHREVYPTSIVACRFACALRGGNTEEGGRPKSDLDVPENHDEGCSWRQAKELMARLEDPS